MSVDARTGEKKWEHTRDVSGAQLSEMKDAIVINDEASVYSLRASDGKENWRYEYEENGKTIAPVLTNDAIYFYVDKTVYALEQPR